MTSVSQLDLDLDVFQGPFDLLLAVLLREEISLAEVSLGDIVLAYVDRLEESGEVDLESVTEFLVLIAALLELKSRLLLPTEDDALELGPEEAADELLARMLEYRRYRDAAAVLDLILEREGGTLYRSAPPPAELRRAAVEAAVQAYEPDRLGSALGELLTPPPEPQVSHIRSTVSVQRRLGVVRDLLRKSRTLDFDEAFGREDRFTQAVTLFALLELHRRGEATWSQKDTFGPIEVKAS
ncbi:segregation/condensation protein A [soil metagenome]